MKYVLKFPAFLFLITISLNAQNAADYFPSQLGHTWNYSLTPLDSLNQEIDSLTFYRADSFAVIANYENKLANIVLTKSGSMDSIQIQQFEDSLFFNFEGSNEFEYTKISTIEGFLSIIDSLGFDTTFSFVDFFKSLEDWYSVYRFGSAVNNQYTIVSVDTTIANDSLTLPLRFEFLGTRLNDEVLMTQIGTFDCKKFLIQRGVSYLIVFPPFPPLAVPIVYIKDTVWIAEDNWIVKSFIPSETVDLSILGIPAFTIPGLKMDVLDILTGLQNFSVLPDDIYLMQNYPNPFNPDTRIYYSLNIAQPISIKVYDNLGREVKTLLNDFKDAGYHSIIFDGGGLASGVYYYSLKTKNYSLTKKMLLLK